MPRSSRHRSHRSRKHSQDRSESEDDEIARDKRSREEEPAASSGVRVSRDPESEKRITSVAPGDKDASGISNGDAFSEHVKKRKERVEDAADTDRWNGGEEDYKKAKGDYLELDKSSKSKHVVADLKGRSSRRREGSNERNEDGVGKSESGKRKTERDSSRRESSSGLYKDVKEDRERGSGRERERVSERDRERVLEREREHIPERENRYERDKERTERDKERGSDREKYGVSDKERERVSQRERDRDREANDVGYENYDYSLSRRQRSSNVGSKDEERVQRKDVKLNELQVQDVMPSSGLLKGFDKHMRDGSEDNKWLHDGRDGDDRRLSSRDDHSKHRSYKDEIHEDGKHMDKKLDDVDRDHRHREERARDRASERSEIKPVRDEVKIVDSRYRKSKHDNENDHDGGQSVDAHNIKPKVYRGKKRFSYENEDYNEFKPSNGKEQQEDADKHIVTSRIDSQVEKSRSDYRQSDKLEPSPRNNRQKIASSSNAYPVKDQVRDSIKHGESAWKESSSEDRARLSVSRSTASGVHERVSFIRSEKDKLKIEIHSVENYVETAASTKYERAPMSDAHSSPNQRRERSSSISDRRFSERTGAKHGIDTGGQKNSSLKDRDRAEKAILDDSPHTDAYNRESTPAGSSINRIGHFTGNSPNHVLPPPALRLGVDSPSVLGSYEDERSQIGDRKSYSRYKRTGDLTFARGHLNAWKNPTWPSPLGNGFIPLHHGVPPGYHPPVAQFPAPPMFGVRPPMDLTHSGISYHMHDPTDSFHGHGRPFGWHNAVDQSCPPHMQLWDGSNGAFGDEPHMYGRSDWDHNRNLLNTRGWEMAADMWKSQNGSMNVGASTPKKELEQLVNTLADETQVIQGSHDNQNVKFQLEFLPAESIEAKHNGDSLHGKNASEGGPQRLQNKKSSGTSNVSGNEAVNFVSNYLSRIDISPILADSDLYKRCTSLHGILNKNCSPMVTDHIHFQKDKDGSSRKMNVAGKILSSFLPAVKESIFQSAISLYKKQNESSKVKLHIPLICSQEKKEPMEESGICEKGVKVGEENKSLEEMLPPDDAGTDSNMETQDDDTTANEHANSHPAEADDKGSNFFPGAVICANDSQACDSPSEEIRVNLSRIPNSAESTH